MWLETVRLEYGDTFTPDKWLATVPPRLRKLVEAPPPVAQLARARGGQKFHGNLLFQSSYPCYLALLLSTVKFLSCYLVFITRRGYRFLNGQVAVPQKQVVMMNA